jgi:hypothetical protein
MHVESPSKCIPKTCDGYTTSVTSSCVHSDHSATEGTELYDICAGSSGKTTVTAAGNKTIIMISSGRNTTPGAAPVASSRSSATTSDANYNRRGFNNLDVLTFNGKTFPVKYTITGGILADKDRSTSLLVLNPGANGGNFTTELPRNP